MAVKLIDESILGDIADAIRFRGGLNNIDILGSELPYYLNHIHNDIHDCEYGGFLYLLDDQENIRFAGGGTQDTNLAVIGTAAKSMYSAFEMVNIMDSSPICGMNVVNMDYAYSHCTMMQAQNSVCGLRVENMAYAYFVCTNLIRTPACGPRVVNMTHAYDSCYNLCFGLNPPIGPKVQDMSYAFANMGTNSSVKCAIYGNSLVNGVYAFHNCRTHYLFVDCAELKNAENLEGVFNNVRRTTSEPFYMFVNVNNGSRNVGNLGPIENLIPNLFNFNAEQCELEEMEIPVSGIFRQMVVTKTREDASTYNVTYTFNSKSSRMAEFNLYPLVSSPGCEFHSHYPLQLYFVTGYENT